MRKFYSFLAVILSILLFSCKKHPKEIQPELPTVLTSPVGLVTASSATCGGNVTSMGSSQVTSLGVCWDTIPGPTILKSHTDEGPGSGTYGSTLTNLESGTTYYVRAYATNEAGTAYGDETSFKTIPSWKLQSTGQSYTMIGSNNSFLFGINYSQVGYSADEGKTWNNITGNVGLSNLNCLFVDQNVVLIAGYPSMVKSTDNGTSWTTPGGIPPSTNIHCFASDGVYIYAGTYNNAIYRSSDNGSNWTTVNNGLPSNTYVFSMFTSGGTIYAGTNNGILVSNNNGNTWTMSNAGLPAGVNANILCFTSLNNRVFAGAGNYYGIYYSDDNGTTWNKLFNCNTSAAVRGLLTANGQVFSSSDYLGIYTFNKTGSPCSLLNSGLTNISSTNFFVTGNSSRLFLLTTNSLNQGAIYKYKF